MTQTERDRYRRYLEILREQRARQAQEQEDRQVIAMVRRHREREEHKCGRFGCTG